MKLQTVDYDHGYPQTIIVVPDSVPAPVQFTFITQLARMAGYTAWPGRGGWLDPTTDRTVREPVTVYMSSGLSEPDMLELVRFLLASSNEQEIYTQRGGQARGYRREATPKPAAIGHPDPCASFGCV